MDEINQLNNLIQESEGHPEQMEWQGCMNCRFGYSVPDTDLVKCRRYPPQVYVLADTPTFRFPRLHYQMWCGEWKFDGITIIPDQ